MFENVREDVSRCHWRSTPPTRIDLLVLPLRQFGLQAVIAYRMGRWLRSLRVRPIWAIAAVLLYPCYWIVVGYVRLAYDIRIEQSANIGPGLYVGHFGGIVLRNCRIGCNCSIGQQVKIGAPTSSERIVDIGDNVWIGAHAQILVPSQIGSGATIGAGAVVTGDVPPRALVLGNPARVTQRDYDNSKIL